MKLKYNSLHFRLSRFDFASAVNKTLRRVRDSQGVDVECQAHRAICNPIRVPVRGLINDVEFNMSDEPLTFALFGIH